MGVHELTILARSAAEYTARVEAEPDPDLRRLMEMSYTQLNGVTRITLASLKRRNGFGKWLTLLAATSKFVGGGN